MEQRLCLLQSKSARERAYRDNVRAAGKFISEKMGLVLVMILAIVSGVLGEEQGQIVEPDNNLGDSDGELAGTDVVLAFVVRSATILLLTRTVTPDERDPLPIRIASHL